jgi:hypothetical protein
METLIIKEEAMVSDDYRQYFGFAIVTDYRFKFELNTTNNNKYKYLSGHDALSSFFPEDYLSVPISSILK